MNCYLFHLLLLNLPLIRLITKVLNYRNCSHQQNMLNVWVCEFLYICVYVCLCMYESLFKDEILWKKVQINQGLNSWKALYSSSFVWFCTHACDMTYVLSVFLEFSWHNRSSIAWLTKLWCLWCPLLRTK